jgi:hypothetical protein
MNKRFAAQAEAYDQAAGTLERGHWTDDPLEQREGHRVARRLHATAARLRRRAAQLRDPARRTRR